ncbi:MAG: DUF4118 domain-containing protein [Coriobacteriales bacterium]|nr:DUF4118 domain-containing protein [Coriobacteriales bacterium]
MASELTQYVNGLDAGNNKDTQSGQRGSLKLFFGYAAKEKMTSAMLSEARLLMGSGRDVFLPELRVDETTRGVPFDVDQTLKRNPDFAVLEDLSQENPQSARNHYRYQDVEELLKAGISVFSTLCVTDLKNEQENLKRLGLETSDHVVPDYIFYHAEEVEFIDIDPQELTKQEALSEDAAMCFTQEHFTQLRILALRCMGDYALHKNAAQTQAQPADLKSAQNTVLAIVEVGSPSSEILRTAMRLASSIAASLEVVCVRPHIPENSSKAALESKEHEQLAGQVRAMGLELVDLYGDDAVEVLSDYVRTRSVSDVVLARHTITWFKRLTLPMQLTFEERLEERLGSITVHLISQKEEEDSTASTLRRASMFTQNTRIRDFVFCIVTVLCAALLARGMTSLGFSETVTYVISALAVALVAAVTRNYFAGICAALLCCAYEDFLFIRPYLNFAIDHRVSAISLVVIGICFILLSALVCRMSRAAVHSKRREYHTQALFDLNKSLVYAQGTREVADTSLDAIAHLVNRSVAFYIRDPLEKPSYVDRAAVILRLAPGDVGSEEFYKLAELNVVHWVFLNGEEAGNNTPTHEQSIIRYVPLTTHGEVIGVLGISARKALEPSDITLLELASNQVVLALERQRFASEHIDDMHLVQIIDIRSHFLRDIMVSMSLGSEFIHMLLDDIQKTSDKFYREALVRICSDESSRTYLTFDKIEEMLSNDVPQELCHVREQVLRAVDDVRAGLAGKVIGIEPGEEPAPIVADAILIRLAIRLCLEAAISYIDKNGIVSIEVHDQSDAIAIIVSDDRPGSLGNHKAYAFEIQKDAAGDATLVYETKRIDELTKVVHDKDLMTGDQQACLEAICQAVRIPRDAVYDVAAPTTINRLRLVRFDKLEYGLYIAALIVNAHGGTIRQRYRLGGGAVVSISLPKQH